ADRHTPLSLPARLTQIAQQAEACRIEKKFAEAARLARDVLREAALPPPAELQSLPLTDVRERIAPELRAPCALALCVYARFVWFKSTRAHSSERLGGLPLVKKYFECAVMLDPYTVEHRIALHSFMHDYRVLPRHDRPTISSEIDELLTSLKSFIPQRFNFSLDASYSNWNELSPRDKGHLGWCLEEASALCLSRASVLVHSDRQAAEEYFQESIAYGLATLKVLGLASNPADFAGQNLTKVEDSTLRHIKLVVMRLEQAYAHVNEFEALEATRSLGDYVAFRLGEHPAGREHRRPPAAPHRRNTPTSSARETASPRPANTPQRRDPLRPTQSDEPRHPATPAPAPVNRNAWPSAVRLAMKNEPFSIPAKILSETHGPIDRIKNKTKFPNPALDKAISEFAIEIDLIGRTQNDSARMFVDHYIALYEEHKADPVTLIRMQIGAGYVLDAAWLDPAVASTARKLAMMSNVDLQQMGLRADLITVQGIFKAITTAAKFNRLRSRA
ncbi:MAG: hypothetical protein J0M12_16765, partial [Deltaproteobacteria bacterium]|nr:hypothetical protein [Deltaproteobacteria bacterium]